MSLPPHGRSLPPLLHNYMNPLSTPHVTNTSRDQKRVKAEVRHLRQSTASIATAQTTETSMFNGALVLPSLNACVEGQAPSGRSLWVPRRNWTMCSQIATHNSLYWFGILRISAHFQPYFSAIRLLQQLNLISFHLSPFNSDVLFPILTDNHFIILPMLFKGDWHSQHTRTWDH